MGIALGYASHGMLVIEAVLTNYLNSNCNSVYLRGQRQGTYS